MTGGMMFKGTPGPWVADEYMIVHEGIYIRSKSRHWSIAAVHATDGCADPSRDVSELEAKANALLIAAAPELLEALTQILAEYDSWKGYNDDGFEDETEALARAAVAKALGEQK